MTFDLVTGGTGLLGSHIAERLVQQGRRVRALVRPSADIAFLDQLGAELVVGDLTDRESCVRATQDVRVVYHAAAKVGDWGNWAEFQSGCLDATENLARAALANGVDRFVHISSTSAYGHPAEGGPPIDESAPLGQNLWPVWDYYTRSKVESERLLWDLAGREGLPLTVIRPSWLFGERDRTTTARLVRRLRAGGVPLIGRGDNPLSAIYAGCVADAAILAADRPRLGRRGVQHHRSRADQPARLLQPLGRGPRRPTGPQATSLSGSLRRGLPSGSPGPADPSPVAPAHHSLRHLADGPTTRLQHRQGPRPGSAGSPR